MVIKNKIVSFHRLSQFCEKHFCLCQTSTATKLTNQQKKSDENSKRSEMCLLFILCFVPLELPYQVKNVQYHWLYPTNKTITINASILHGIYLFLMWWKCQYPRMQSWWNQGQRNLRDLWWNCHMTLIVSPQSELSSVQKADRLCNWILRLHQMLCGMVWHGLLRVKLKGLWHIL